MSLNLEKGQKISLLDLTKGTKESPGLSRVLIGLGWEEVSKAQPKGGLLSGLFGGGEKAEEVDCDAMVFLLDSNGQCKTKADVVYFGNLTHKSNCVTHKGDNIIGGSGGDDEQIIIDLAKLPSQYEKAVIMVSIYDAHRKNQHFGMIRNAFMRLVDADSNKQLLIYNLTEGYPGKAALIFGELYRQNGTWQFEAIGEGLEECFVAQLGARYGLVWQK